MLLAFLKANAWPIAMVAILLPAAFIAGEFWDTDGREDRAYRKAAQTNQLMQLACMTDKASAWEEVRNARTEKHNQAVMFDRILVAGDDERAAYRTQLAASAVQYKRARDEAADITRRLDDARSELAKTWREGRIPADITCGVLKSPGCPGIPGPAAGAADARAQPVPPGPAGDAATGQPGGGAAVPGSSADRPGDL
jgi:hypothetical protein